jgi:hypothetical protein
MTLELADARTLLGRTPGVLDSLVRGLPEAWLHANEGPDTWSSVDVVGHLPPLLATWAVHDLNHLGQIVGVLAGQHTEAVGPWRAFLGILDRPRPAP